MADDLRARIAAVLQGSWPAPWFDGGRQHQQVADLADAVIRELNTALVDFGLWLSEEITGKPMNRIDLESCLTDWKEGR